MKDTLKPYFPPSNRFIIFLTMVVALFIFSMPATTAADNVLPDQGCVNEASLISLNSDTPTSITFINKTSETVYVYWRNFDGERVLYNTLPAGDSYLQLTFVTHPWIIIGESGECYGIFLPTVSAATVIVSSSLCNVSDLTKIPDSNFESTAPDPPLGSLFLDVEEDLSQKIISFQVRFNSKFGFFPPRTSGYRSPAHQEHLYELKTKLMEIREEIRRDPAQATMCKQLKMKIDDEICNRHGLAGANCLNGVPQGNPQVSKISAHTIFPAAAVDLGGIERLTPDQQKIVDRLANDSGLCRPCRKSNGELDKVHFTLKGSPCNATIRGTMQSPVDIMITDPLGRKVGFDPITASIVNEIGSSAFYSGPGTEPQIIEIGGAIPGTYIVTGIGIGTGPYRLTLERVDEDGEVLESQVTSGNILPGGSVSLSISEPLTVLVDIKPDDLSNSVNTSNNGTIPVAILSSSAFDATTQVNRNSLTFGRTGEENSLAFPPKPEDVNGDGLMDLICHFDTQRTNLTADDSQAVLLGKMITGTVIQGMDFVQVVH
jgi:hypothetical protein